MIRYDLICDQGHEFDGWFADSAAFDKLHERRLLSCNHCGTSKVEKQLMAPGIPVRSNRKADAPVPLAAGPTQAEAQRMLELMREYKKAVTAQSEYVGPAFAEEARKMHYKERETRPIYGEAKPEDAVALIEEGIEVHPLPHLPEDSN